MSTIIDVVDGSISRGGRPVLRGVNLSVPRGQVVALLGSNGSGKSTLVRGILGLSPWVRGEARLFGTPVTSFRDWRKVGFVPQRASAGSGVPATVSEVVASGRLPHRRLLLPLSGTDRGKIRHAIATVGLTDRSNDAVSQLSGGQQQRVLIARALATDPDLFVLDEPLAGVDLQNQERLAAALRPLVESGTTVLLVLHELGPLAQLIDRAIVLRDGRVAYDGPPPDVGDTDGTHDHHHPAQAPDTVPMQSGWEL
jgi:zinc transport system ATP-binding protein